MKLSGDRNQCPTCGEYFNSSAAFDKHRVGYFSSPRQTDNGALLQPRRCLSGGEMLSKGMAKRNGFWITSPMPENLRQS